MKKLRIKNILVPVDFSQRSTGAIRTANRLAQRFGATVHLTHIYQCDYPVGFFAPTAPVPLSPAACIEDARKAASQRLAKLAAQHDITGDCYVPVGAPVFDEICRIAGEIPADLIVTSTHGRTGLKHALLGSTAERLVQHSPCPVLVARETKAKSPKSEINRILVPVDFSDCSLQALKYAMQFADAIAAKIVVLNAVHFDYAFTADGYAMYDLSRLQDAVYQEAQKQMGRFVRRAKFGGVKFEARVEVGMPLDVIRMVAQESKVDLIITATHGRTGLKHVLIGSTAELVVRHAPCPVLVVPSHPQERARQLTSRDSRTHGMPESVGRRTKFGKVARKLSAHPFPERRQTNKFRESHFATTSRVPASIRK